MIAPAFMALSALAETTTNPEATTTPEMPGVPATGAGGDLAMNLALLAIAVGAIIIGAFQFRKKARGDNTRL
jgi:hypothetical protein